VGPLKEKAIGIRWDPGLLLNQSSNWARVLLRDPKTGAVRRRRMIRSPREDVLDSRWFWSPRLGKNAGLRGFAEIDMAVKRAVAVMISAGC